MKKKHKLLLVLSCIPLLISCLVLPLCSFTTTNNNSYYIYGTNADVDIGYSYYNGTTTYYGSIPRFNQWLVSASANTHYSRKDSVKFSACNYLMASSYSIDYVSFNSNAYGAYKSYWNEAGDGGTMLVSDNVEKTKLLGNIHITNYDFSDSYISFLFHSLDDMTNILSFREVGSLISATIVYSYLRADGKLEYDLLTVSDYDYYRVIADELGTNELRIEPLIIDLFEAYSPVEFDFTDLSISANIPYITSIDLDVSIYDRDLGYFTNEFGGITCRYIPLNKTDYRNEWLLNFDFKSSYNKGYNEGYNAGISRIDTVWPSLGEFLQGSVGSFMDAEIFPNFRIGTVLSVFVGAVLLLGFLKVFAGG